MRRILPLFVCCFLTISSFGQEKAAKKTFDLSGRPNDHLMTQFTYDNWTSAPDSINSHIGGFSRGANIYLMLDKPFRGNQHFSVGFGLGVGTSNIFFNKLTMNIGSTQTKLPLTETDTTGSFSKYKLTSAFLEVPLEFRFSSRPDKPNQSTKFAIGIKAGTLLNVHTKGKEFKDGNGATLISGNQKQSSKKFFNTSRLAATARIGYGVWGLFASYSLTPIFKSGVAADDAKLWQMGITLTGL